MKLTTPIKSLLLKLILTNQKIRSQKFTEEDTGKWREQLHKMVDKIKEPENVTEVYYNLIITFIENKEG